MSPKSVMLILLALLFFAAGGYFFYTSAQSSMGRKEADPQQEPAIPGTPGIPLTTGLAE